MSSNRPSANVLLYIGRRGIEHSSPRHSFQPWLELELKEPARATAICARLLLAAAQRAAEGEEMVRDRSATGLWGVRAARLAKAGALPLPAGFPADEHIRRLASLRGPQTDRTVFIHCGYWVADSEAATQVDRAAEWITSRTQGSVVLSAPAEADVAERLRALPRWSPPEEAGRSTGKVSFQRNIGKPHPLSESESRLAEAILQDHELAGLFVLNAPVETPNGRSHRVDLLWEAGRLVVEVDAYALHGTEESFHADRQRDFELLAADYQVLRVTDHEIFQDVSGVIEKIRVLVTPRRKKIVS